MINYFHFVLNDIFHIIIRLFVNEKIDQKESR